MSAPTDPETTSADERIADVLARKPATCRTVTVKHLTQQTGDGPQAVASALERLAAEPESAVIERTDSSKAIWRVDCSDGGGGA